MGKQKKNSNYLTKRSEEIKRQKEAEALKKKKRNIIITVSIIAAAFIIGGVLALGFGVFGWGETKFEVTHHATIEIENYGTVELELYGKEAPITVENFVNLANSGFYNGLTFHRIIEGFMAQGGRSTSTSVSTIKGEFKANGIENRILHERGVISMARSDNYDSASSQFFIMHKTTPDLDELYAAFGRVTGGIAVIDKICEDAKPYDGNGGILPANQPVIKKITVKSA